MAKDFVILGRSKERSDAAQTLESMPRLSPQAQMEQNSATAATLRLGNGMDPRVSATELRVRYAHRMTKLIGLGQSPTAEPYPTMANASRILPDAVLTGFWPIHCTCRPRVAAADSVLPCRKRAQDRAMVLVGADFPFRAPGGEQEAGACRMQIVDGGDAAAACRRAPGSAGGRCGWPLPRTGHRGICRRPWWPPRRGREWQPSDAARHGAAPALRVRPAFRRLP